MNRVSIVDNLKMTAIGYSTIVLVGDSAAITPRSRSISVNVENLMDEEDDYSKHSLFTMPLPLPLVNEPLQMQTDQSQSTIHVGDVYIISFSTSSVLQIGSTALIHSEARDLEL